MGIITISHDPDSHGEKIAKMVAEKLGYQCIGPEIIRLACRSLDCPLSKLQEALHNSPSFVEYITPRKAQYLAMFRSVFFEYMSRDNIVYHGLAGHIFLADVPSVIKVRIIADFEDRIRERMQRENIGYHEAEKELIKGEKERARWTKLLYGKDHHDPRLYDIYLNLRDIGVDAAVAIIVDTAYVSTNGHHEMMRRKLWDMALAAKTEARLLEVFPEVETIARDGEVFVSIKGSILQEQYIAEKARNVLDDVRGIRTVRIGVPASPYVPF
jgi:cytidylate kinase